jgi:DNA (cytosine-5)-methyltransferase 1
MRHGSLFSGIGGFDLAAKWAGWQNVFHCEYEPFAKQVLKHHFPNSKLYEDVRTFDATDYAGRIDILTGGFPCQPFSTSGKRKGTEDERHLWPEMLRIIREISPRYVVGENVRGLVNWSGGLVFEQVCADLEAEGYEVLPFILPAASVNAPHRRDRIWFVAYSNCGNDRRAAQKNERTCGKERLQERHEVWKPTESSKIFGDATNTESVGRMEALENRELEGRRFRKRSELPTWNTFPSKPPICGGDDGLPRKLDAITFPKWRSGSLKAYGNAIVPQVAHEIFKVINKIENELLLR